MWFRVSTSEIPGGSNASIRWICGWRWYNEWGNKYSVHSLPWKDITASKYVCTIRYVRYKPWMRVSSFLDSEYGLSEGKRAGAYWRVLQGRRVWADWNLSAVLPVRSIACNLRSVLKPPQSSPRPSLPQAEDTIALGLQRLFPSPSMIRTFLLTLYWSSMMCSICPSRLAKKCRPHGHLASTACCKQTDNVTPSTRFSVSCAAVLNDAILCWLANNTLGSQTKTQHASSTRNVQRQSSTESSVNSKLFVEIYF